MASQPKLHQLLAAEPTLGNKARTLTMEARNLLNKESLFTGSVKTTTYLSDDRQEENTDEIKVLDTTVNAVMGYALAAICDYWDATLSKDIGNQTAVADIEVKGQILAKDVPATTLLGLETRLLEIRTLLSTAHTLPPGIAWKANDTAHKDSFIDPYTTVTFKTEKVVTPVVLYPHTDKHPAQVKETSSDVRVARIDTVRNSGMLSVADKAARLNRLDELLVAIRVARMKANDVSVATRQISRDLMTYVMGQDLTKDVIPS
jgi:hypothetical protein